MDSSQESKLVLSLLKGLDDQVEVPRDLWHGKSYSTATAPDEVFQASAVSVLPPGEYIVTKTDNVMDAEDWGVWKVSVADGRVVIVENLNPANKGMHSAPTEEPFELLRSMAYDATGVHPETYCRVYRVS